MKNWLIAPTLLLGLAASSQAQNFQPPADVLQLMSKHTCLTCHKMTERSVGPSYSEVAKKKYSKKQIVNFIYKPEPSHWPDYAPMAPLPNVPKADAQKIAAWIESLGKQ